MGLADFAGHLAAHRCSDRAALAATVGPRPADPARSRLSAAPADPPAIAALARRAAGTDRRCAAVSYCGRDGDAGLLEISTPQPHRRCDQRRTGRGAALADWRDAADPAHPVLIERARGSTPRPRWPLPIPAASRSRPIGTASSSCLRLRRIGEGRAVLARPGRAVSSAVADRFTGTTIRCRRTEIAGEGRAPMSRLSSAPHSRSAICRTPNRRVPRLRRWARTCRPVIGAFGGEPPLIRLHSECLTGDVFGSLKCDAARTQGGLEMVGAAGGGVCSICARKAGHRPRQQAARLCACRIAGSIRGCQSGGWVLAMTNATMGMPGHAPRAGLIDRCGC